MDKTKIILDAFNFRHACKSFDATKKISAEDFDTILSTGHLSPSSFGWEPWKFLVIQNPDLRKKMAEFSWGAQKQLATSSHFVIYLVAQDKILRDMDYIDNFIRQVQQVPEEIVKIKGDFYRNFIANDFKLDTARKLTDWASRQVYIPLGNMMTAAALLGIDSCPIEGFSEEKMNIFLQEELKINTQEYAVAVTCAFGYRATEPKMKTRRNINEVITWFK